MDNLREKLMPVGVSITIFAAVDVVKEAIKQNFKEKLQVDIDYPLETLYILQWVENYFILKGYTQESVLQTITDTQIKMLFGLPEDIAFAIRAVLDLMCLGECSDKYTVHLFGENNPDLNIESIIANTLARDTHLFA